ncbi:two-component system, sensor histidine kinase YesM [Paenibacillus sp. 1_12]|uniref:sensor histidine kinase n=1 Tax=Paenibacillus sp. 1_12 TaxID=1566278 RepID=UPI0008EE9847|nr:sensor histidine kinase [Paenibacillus sp. 1_12]SFK66780.1 two-component system, sensor histidine kinase YesM [Paenibacillus sp. 1_12]
MRYHVRRNPVILMILKNWFGIRKSIQRKIFISFMLVMFLPTTIISVSTYYFSIDLLKRKVSESFLDNLAYNKNIISIEFKQFEKIADYILYNSDIQKVLSPNFRQHSTQAYYDLEGAQQSLTNFTMQAFAVSNVASIQIFGDNGIILFTGATNEIYPNDEKLKEISWYGQAIKMDKPRFWFGNADETSSRSNLSGNGYTPSMVKTFRNSATLEKLGVIYIKIRNDLFDNLFEDSNMKKIGKFVVVDDNGLIVHDPDKNMLLKTFPDIDKLKLQKGDHGSFITKDGQLMVYYYIERYGWWLTDSIPLSELLKDNKIIFNISITVVLICFILSGIIWYFVSSGIVRPIKQLTSVMLSVKEDGLAVKSEYKGNDEIGLLSSSFNYMIERIQDLITEMVEEQTKKKDMEYQSLQAQINPHFLYNSLNSIRWMAMIHKADNIKEMVEALGRLLVNCTSKRDAMITIEEELTIVKDYIKIQEIKYSDKFYVDYDIEPNLMKVKCIKFILQPFIENAIFHGIEPKSGIGCIRIQMKFCNDIVEIVVHDDGVGMDVARILNDESNGKRFNGIGIKNVDERLRLTYGEKYGIRIESVRDEYTSVNIRFPIDAGLE